jgi:FAD-linked oxidoreductase
MSDHLDNFSPERRRFLTTLGVAGAGALGVGSGLIALPAQARAEAASWQNWSGSQKVTPANILYPDSEDALSKAIRESTGQVRAFGGGHSFNAVVPTAGTLVSLEAMNGIVRHDAAALTATLWAGTRVASAGPLLNDIGQGILNEADINMQSIGGAISTATHGTGRQMQCYSATVKDLRIVLADGSITDCSLSKDRELFEAARVAVGSIGIFSQITLQNRATYKLREQVNVMSITDAMHALQSDRDKHRHMEFFAFPFGEKAIVKRMDISTEPTTPVEKPSIDENKILEFAADSARNHPWTNRWWQKLVGAFVSDSVRVGPSYEIFPSPRTVGFNEMEYSVPADRGLECFQEVLEVMRKNKVNVFFPIEFRYIGADECWMSPFYQRPTASISVHQYYKQDYQPFFKLVEPIFWKYQGRPHWGKLHTLGAAQLRELYPRFEDFVKVRQRIDPQGRFLNDFARKLFLG